MPSLTRRSVASASLLLALAGCSTPESRPTPSPSPAVATPSATAPPGTGERSRYLRRRFPVANGQWTERILYYRTPTYLVELRLTGPTATEAAFLALARQARDRIAAGLKAS